MFLKFHNRLDSVELVRILTVSGDLVDMERFTGSRPFEITTIGVNIAFKTSEEYFL